MNLVDSSGWVHYFQNGPLAEQFAPFLAKPKTVLTPSIVIYEVYKRLSSVSDGVDAKEAVAYMRETEVLPLTEISAVEAAETALEFKLSMADAIIYSEALSHKVKLITCDADFKNLPDVTYFESAES